MGRIEVKTNDALADLCDQLQAAVDEFRRRMEENPLPCGSRALAIAVESGLPVQLAYTLRETASYTGVNQQQLLKEIHAGRLRAKLPLGCSKGYRVTVDEMDRWMDAM